ncbi:MAG: HEAT repeat domain-containing protein, partial [Holophagales bacterium]|nr:HEAT repeat domain-containing protein [Holophagales bacterium]
MPIIRSIGLAAALTLLVSSGPMAAQQVSIHPGLDSTDFAPRWSWAEKSVRSAPRGAWIGYAVDHWTSPGSYYFAGSVRIRGNGVFHAAGTPLSELLGAAVPEAGGVAPISTEVPGSALRSLAVLVRLEPGAGVGDLDVLDLAFPADLEGKPLAWIGKASAEDSFRLLTGLYERAAHDDAREELVEGVGLHDRAEAVGFLARILDSNASVDVREEAAEALAEQSNPRAITVLARAARSNA